MARVIKFRGKSVKTGEWLYGYLQKYQETHASRLCVCAASVRTWSDALLYEVIPETIGQFTGLHDKNGKEIYEGDIVKNKEIGGYGLEYVGVVRYYENDCRFGIDITATNKFSTRILFTKGECTINDGHCTIKYTNEYEVQGNIHDNPELLNNK